VNLLKASWRWLSQSKNQKILALIGVGVAAVVSGIWQVYLHISEKPKDSLAVSASNGSIGAGGNVSPTASTGGIAVVATGSVTIGIPLERYEAGLRRMEQEVRAELSEANAADKYKFALLERQLTEIQAKRKNPESALEEYKAKLAQAYKAFDDLKREVLPEQIKQAQEATITSIWPASISAISLFRGWPLHRAAGKPAELAVASESPVPKMKLL
jgi:hypothetical protein